MGIAIIESLLAVALIASILMQNRASGLTGSSGGAAATVQRRGAERLIYRSTFVFGTAFFLLIIVDWFI